MRNGCSEGDRTAESPAARPANGRAQFPSSTLRPPAGRRVSVGAVEERLRVVFVWDVSERRVEDAETRQLILDRRTPPTASERSSVRSCMDATRKSRGKPPANCLPPSSFGGFAEGDPPR